MKLILGGLYCEEVSSNEFIERPLKTQGSYEELIKHHSHSTAPSCAIFSIFTLEMNKFRLIRNNQGSVAIKGLARA